MKSAARIALSIGAIAAPLLARPEAGDPRLREVQYDPRAVVTVPVKRGVVTHIVLGADEAITDVGAGLGGDCKAESAWCIAAQAGSRHLFVKPKSTAAAANNLAVVTDRRTHAFRFVVVPDGDARQPVYRLMVKPPILAAARPAAASPPLLPPVGFAPVAAPATAPSLTVEERLTVPPHVLNSSYSVSEGKHSEEIVPTLVFDDGRFTYLRFSGNREVPAVFQVLADGSETLVNTRMEGDLLVVDRVSRRLMLRSGDLVVGLWNEAFDADGVPPVEGTTAPGVQRALKGNPHVDADPARRAPDSHGAPR